MNSHIIKVYVPMTETAFYILFCLQKPNHGYGVIQQVEKMTNLEIRIAPGTMYGSLSKMEKDGLIRFVKEEEKRKVYVITELGLEVLTHELERIKRLYSITQKEVWYEKSFQVFSIFGYEKEEQYLRKMHNNGYKLSKVSSIGLYTFEECEEEDVVYRLDFQDSFKDEKWIYKNV